MFRYYARLRYRAEVVLALLIGICIGFLAGLLVAASLVA